MGKHAVEHEVEKSRLNSMHFTVKQMISQRIFGELTNELTNSFGTQLIFNIYVSQQT